MSVDKAIELLKQALTELQPIPPLPTPPTIVTVTAGQSVQAALDAAADGTTIQVEPGIYPETVTIKGNRIVLMPTTALRPGRIDPGQVPVWIQGATAPTGVQNVGTNNSLRGIGVRTANHDATLLADTGVGLILDRVVLMGDATGGQHRGFQPHGQQATITGSVIDQCWQVGRDAQAICGWDGTDGLNVFDCWLAGGAETVLFGGADSTDASRIPKNIRILRSTLTKRPEWYGTAQIKCAFEVKAGQNVSVQDSVLEYGGISGGSTGYVVLLTPRNQGGKAPWTEVRNVTIERCRLQHGGGGINLMATDDTQPSGPLDTVTVRNTLITDIDPTRAWGGQGRMFMFNAARTGAPGPANVTLDSLTLEGANVNAIAYFIKNPPVKLVAQNIKQCASKYDWKIDGGGMGLAAVRAYAPDAAIAISGSDTGASGYPA